MKKLIFISILLFISCNKQQSNTTAPPKAISKTKSLTYVKTIKIPTDSISKISYLTFRNENDFFTVDPYKNKIFRCQFQDSIQIQQIGQRGQGPGEYIQPFRVYINDQQIFYSDFSHGIIKGYDLKTKEEILNLHNNGSAFRNHKNHFFVKNFLIPKGDKNLDNHLLSIYNIKTGKLIKKAFNIDEKYSWVITGLAGDMTYDKTTGRFYIVNNAPYTIFCIDTTLTVHSAINMETKNPPGFISSEKTIDNIKKIVKNSHGRNNPKKLKDSFHKIISLDMIYTEDSSFFLVGLTKNSDELLYHLIDTGGTIIDYFTCNQQTEYVCGVYGNRIYIFNSKKYNQNPDFNFLDVYQVEL